LNTTAPSAASASLNTIPLAPATSQRERLAPRLDGPLAHVVAVETQKVKGDQRGFCPALSGHERVEVAPPVGSQRHSLAVDQRLGAVEGGNRLGDLCKAIREVGAASAPDLDAFALPEGEDAKAVVFDLMQPAGAGWGVINERGFARADEAERCVKPPTGPGRVQFAVLTSSACWPISIAVPLRGRSSFVRSCPRFTSPSNRPAEVSASARIARPVDIRRASHPLPQVAFVKASLL
jgi:hypothetical protein